MTEHVAATASTPLVRFVPGASAVPDQMVDQWVEQELRRGRSSVRAGLAMLACLAVVAIPLVSGFERAGERLLVHGADFTLRL